ncbi:mandelate racemase/muconate lactonizing enzyme family protein [Haloferax gibbonsii]|uniref:Mandelate racemase/muconate lactonizing enzyme C-terminal domain-containing protein n=1 Tax=Haloferax gibbonsii TaxID=35746 RepID=A0A0K1IZV5_HALGI|nr:mandelate racemase/muconate lactonizing enzyme family protein [Haloferax gibbonsii]AKU09830.1 hypothetical protein ABY42_18600 [Haloferax gibbonsii]
MEIVDFRLRKLVFPDDRTISDSQIQPKTDRHSVLLELHTETGITGYGFGASSLPESEIKRQFKSEWERLDGESPFVLCNRIERPRGGNYTQEKYGGQFQRMVDYACWDLIGKYLEKPLYQVLGGKDPAVPAYASGLAFHHDDDRTRDIYRKFKNWGFDAAKVKVGYPTLEEDIERLGLVADVFGRNPRLMADANEAFSPKEAIRRINAYREAGFDIFWVEDPVFREDVEGIQRVAQAIDFAHINVGEYVNFEQKCRLLENGAVDIMNLQGINAGRRSATVASAYGVPVSYGNTPMDVGIHAAAALPEVVYIEYAHHDWGRVLEQSVRIDDGKMIAPDRPGHGLKITDDAIERYRRSE